MINQQESCPESCYAKYSQELNQKFDEQKKFTRKNGLNNSVIIMSSAGPAKVKMFLGPYYMIKHVPTFVQHVLTFVIYIIFLNLVDFIGQNKVKILYKVKTGQNSLHQKFPNPNPYKNEKNVDFFVFF